MSGHLVIETVIAALFVLTAIKNWRRAIGAGPTILIVGALVVFGVWTYNYTTAHDEQRVRDNAEHTATESYDVCLGKVDRSAGSRAYNLFLIGLLSKAYGPSADTYAGMLRAELDADLPALKYSSCPLPPGMTIDQVPEGP